jgi:predicted ATPase/DNA-binding SARP family transcriptional activator
MEFRVLGPLEVVDDGTPLALTAPRHRALVAALLLRPGQSLTGDALSEALWDGDPPESAASLVRLYVSQVRRLLPDGRLVRRQRGYALTVDAGELDADVFEALAADARSACANGSLRRARSLYERGLELWRGPALADLAYEPFTRDEAARLDELRLQCREELLAVELDLGRHAEALPGLERLVAEEPLRERPRGLLMLALYRAGRHADALESYREARRLCVDELGLEPGPELRALEGRILRHDPSLVTSSPAHEETRVSIPVPATASIGRDEAISELADRLLAPESRLVTLVGPGGVGKTRLAVEASARVASELADGAVFVELARLGDPGLLLAEIGRALGIRETGESWPELLAAYLRPLELLVVLDNLEHLTTGVAPLADLLASAPRLKLLATSTTVLRLSGEHVVTVPPLRRDASFELFVRQSLAAGAPTETVSAAASEIEEICARLDGSPLAIELAAPWLRLLPPSELLRMLDSRLDVLHGGTRDTPPRHQTLRATIDWSYSLLPSVEQRLFAQLSVFAGGFTLDAARAVGGADAAWERLGTLVEASMIQRSGERYRLLELVREYAAERLGDDDRPARRHADHFIRLAERGEHELAGADQARWLAELDADNDNLRAALDFLAAAGDRNGRLRLAAALGRYWYVRGAIGEGLAHLSPAIDEAGAGDHATLAKGLRAASALALIAGDYERARRFAKRALLLYRELRDRVGVVRSLSNLGAILHAQGELDLAASTLDECIVECGQTANERLLALARNNRGDVALSQGDLATAEAHFQGSLEILRRLGDTANVARALYNLGAVAIEQERVSDAYALLCESIELADRIGDTEDVAWCLIALATVAASRSKPVDGARMLGLADTLLDRIGASTKPFERELHDRVDIELREALGPEGFDLAHGEGRALDPADAMGLVPALAVSSAA